MLILPVALLFANAALAQDFSNIQVETVAKDLHYAQGVWSLEGFLLFSDTVTDRLNKFVPERAACLMLEAGRAGLNGNAYDEQGRLYLLRVLLNGGVTPHSQNGKMDVLAARFEGKRLNAPGDIVVRRDGNVYFTDPAFGNQQDARELDFYGVFHIKTSGEIEAVARWKTRHAAWRSRPAAVSSTSRTPTREIFAFLIWPETVRRRTNVFSSEKIEGVPGGLRTDEKAIST